ncbi:uncharacterized protein [Parasteatoda tepidariorum]|uniref:uncharacterized protein n=1 Tax=Parasteatoda tepidariorum TaxID=114398 RepID=UPI0039BD71A5
MIKIFQREDIRLPHPYSTNCTDYLSLWNENNGTGPLNERACIEYCKLEKLKSRACIDEHIWYAPHMEILCGKIVGRHTSTYEIIKDCIRKCKPACREQTYEVTYDEIEFSVRLCPTGLFCR